MESNTSTPHRQSVRLGEFDYSQPGAYFVTIVTQDRKTLFGKIVDGEMMLNEIGMMVTALWVAIPQHSPNVECGEFVVMPNHFHGIISITAGETQDINVGARHAVPRPVSEKEGFGKPVSGFFLLSCDLSNQPRQKHSTSFLDMQRRVSGRGVSMNMLFETKGITGQSTSTSLQIH